jgi:hypothetical protein
MLKPWWERFPGRLEYELEKLREIGISCEPKVMGDTISLEFPYEVGGEIINLIVKFPSSYPYFRFTVDAFIEPPLEHHQNPFTKDLCILGRSTINWSTNDTVAETLVAQMRKVMHVGRSKDIGEVKGLEENQPEPISVYFATQGFIFIDGKFHIGEKCTGQWGSLKIGLAAGNRLAVLSISDDNNSVIANANPHINKLFKEVINGRWIRVREPIIENNPQRFFEKLILLEPKLRVPRWQKVYGNTVIDVIAVVFPEEVEQRVLGEGWLFLVRIKR